MAETSNLPSSTIELVEKDPIVQNSLGFYETRFTDALLATGPKEWYRFDQIANSTPNMIREADSPLVVNETIGNLTTDTGDWEENGMGTTGPHWTDGAVLLGNRSNSPAGRVKLAGKGQEFLTGPRSINLFATYSNNLYYTFILVGSDAAEIDEADQANRLLIKLSGQHVHYLNVGLNSSLVNTNNTVRSTWTYTTHMHTLTSDGTTVKWYIDGNLHDSSLLSNLPTPASVADEIWIGAQQFDIFWNVAYDWLLSNLAWWEKELTATEIADLWKGHVQSQVSDTPYWRQVLNDPSVYEHMAYQIGSQWPVARQGAHAVYRGGSGGLAQRGIGYPGPGVNYRGIVNDNCNGPQSQQHNNTWAENDFTVEFWANSDGSSGNTQIFRTYSNTFTKYWDIGYDFTTNRFYYDTNTTSPVYWNSPLTVSEYRRDPKHHAIIRSGSNISLYVDAQFVGTTTHGSFSYNSADTSDLNLVSQFGGGLVWYTEAKDATWCSERKSLVSGNTDGYINIEHPVVKDLDHFWIFSPQFINGDRVIDHAGGLDGTLVGNPSVTVDGGLITNGIDQYFYVPLEQSNKYWSMVICYRQVEGTAYDDTDCQYWLGWQEPGDDTNVVIRGPIDQTEQVKAMYLGDGTGNAIQIDLEDQLAGENSSDYEQNYFQTVGLNYVNYEFTDTCYAYHNWASNSTGKWWENLRYTSLDQSANSGKVLKLGYQDEATNSGYKKCQVLFIGLKTQGALPNKRLIKVIQSATHLPDLRFISSPQNSEGLIPQNIPITTYNPEFSVLGDTAVEINTSGSIPISTLGLSATVFDNPNDFFYVPTESIDFTTYTPEFETFNDLWVTHLYDFHNKTTRHRITLSPKSAILITGLSQHQMTPHGSDIEDPWFDDANYVGSFIPQDSRPAVNLNGQRWFSLVNEGISFNSASGISTDFDAQHTSFWFFPLSDGGPAISDPRGDGECIFRIEMDDSSGDFLGAYWNDSKIHIQFHGDSAISWSSPTLEVNKYHHIVWYNFFGGSKGDSSTLLILDGQVLIDFDRSLSSYANAFPAGAGSCNIYIGAKNTLGDNPYNGYLQYLSFFDPDEHENAGSNPYGDPNISSMTQWWQGAALSYADQNEWWGRPWGQSSLISNGQFYLPCDDATFPPADLGGSGELTISKQWASTGPVMQSPSFADAPGCMSFEDEQVELNFDQGAFSHQANLAGFPNRQWTYTMWFKWAPNTGTPLVRLLMFNIDEDQLDGNNLRVWIDSSNDTLYVRFGSFDIGSATSCAPNKWHYITLFMETDASSTDVTWELDGPSGGGDTDQFILSASNYGFRDFQLSNSFGETSDYVDLKVAHIQLDHTLNKDQYRKKTNPDTSWTEYDRTLQVIEGPSYSNLAGVTTEYRDASSWLQRNWWSCQIGSEAEFVNEGTLPATDLNVQIYGSLSYLRTNGIIYGMPYTIGLLNTQNGNAINFNWTPSTFDGISPAMWIRFNSWATSNQTTIATGTSDNGHGIWYLERESGTNRIRQRMEIISGFHLGQPDYVSAWVDIGLGEWNFIAFGMYTCDNCSPPSDSKIIMSVNGVAYDSNVNANYWTEYELVDLTIGSQSSVTDGFSADINMISTQSSWDNTAHIVPAYLDGKPDTAVVQAMGSDQFNFISRVNSETTALDYVSQPSPAPTVAGYQPNTTGVTPQAEAGPVGSFDFASRMSSTPRWIELSNPAWNTNSLHVYILEAAFKTTGHSGTGEFKMLCANKNANGVYSYGLVHDNTSNTVKLFWTDASDVEYRSVGSVSWPQDQYNHVIVNREADFTNDRLDLYLNGSIALTATNIQSGATPQLSSSFGGGYFGCVSGDCPTDTYISHIGFRMDDGWGTTELSNLTEHWDAFVLGDRSSGVTGEDNTVNLSRTSDFPAIKLWTRELTWTEQPLSGTILDTQSISIDTYPIQTSVSENNIAGLDTTNIFLNPWNPSVFSLDAQSSEISSINIPINTNSQEFEVTDRNIIQLPTSTNIPITPVGNTWFSSDFQISDILSVNLPINLLEVESDVEENHFIIMKWSYLPLKTNFQRLLNTENHWSDLSASEITITTNNINVLRTEGISSEVPTAQLDLTTQSIEASKTGLRWVDLEAPNIPILSQDVEWTPTRSTDRREVFCYDLEIAKSPGIIMNIGQKVEFNPGPVVQRWILQAAQRALMTSEVVKTKKFNLPLLEIDDSFRVTTGLTKTFKMDRDMTQKFRLKLEAPRAVSYTLNIQQKQEITSPAGISKTLQL